MAEVIKSIGTGKDYTTITAWEAASYGATASDNAVGEVYGTVTESAGVVVDDTTPIDITLQSVSTDRHTGTPGTGAKLVWDTAIAGATFWLTTGVALTIRWLDIDGGDLNHTLLLYTTGGGPHYIYGNLIHGQVSARSAAVRLLQSSGSAHKVHIWNNAIFDLSNSNSAPIGLNFDSGGVSSCYNNTVYNITASGVYSSFGISIRDDNDLTIKNNLVSNITVTGSGTASCYSPSSLSLTTSATNGGDDATSPDGAGYQNLTINYTSAIDFTPLATSSANVLSGGTDLGAVANVDLKGRDRDAQGDTWSLGAIQYVAAGGGGSVPVMMSNYLRMMGC